MNLKTWIDLKDIYIIFLTFVSELGKILEEPEIHDNDVSKELYLENNSSVCKFSL
jgi:hypothetical protein